MSSYWLVKYSDDYLAMFIVKENFRMFLNEFKFMILLEM